MHGRVYVAGVMLAGGRERAFGLYDYGIGERIDLLWRHFNEHHHHLSLFPWKGRSGASHLNFSLYTEFRLL